MHRLFASLKSCLLTFVLTVLATRMFVSFKSNQGMVSWQFVRYPDHNSYFVNEKHAIYKSKSDPGRNLVSQTVVFRNMTNSYNHSTVSLGNFPNWKARSLIKTARYARYTAFEQVISQTEHDRMMDLLQIFKSMCESSNISFMLYGGSLLGAYRHFGLIPWDDDIDVLMNESDATRVKSTFENIPGYSLSPDPGRQWKFYYTNNTANESCCTSREDTRASDCQCNHWPYIDIFFFRENDTHIWDNNKMYRDIYCYKKADMFPLIGFPFKNFIMPVPRNVRKVLDKSYNVDLCVTLHFSHRNELRPKKFYTVPCKRLFPYFPFVFERNYGDIVERSLFIGNSRIYQTLSEK